MWLHFLLLCIWTWKSNGKQNKLYRRPAWDENKIITSKEMANNTTFIWGISVEILTRGKHCNQEPKKMCISSPSDMVKSASFIWILKVNRNAETPNASSCGGCIFQTQLCLICLTDYTLCRFSGISVQTHLNLSYSERFNLILVSKHLSTIKKGAFREILRSNDSI